MLELQCILGCTCSHSRMRLLCSVVCTILVYKLTSLIFTIKCVYWQKIMYATMHVCTLGLILMYNVCTYNSDVVWG